MSQNFLLNINRRIASDRQPDQKVAGEGIMHRGELPVAPILLADVLAVLPGLLPRLLPCDKLVAVASVGEVGPALKTI